MKAAHILKATGYFSDKDMTLFEKYTFYKAVGKNEVLLSDNEVCQNMYYALSGAFFQYRATENTETIVDLHLPGEWLYNQQSLIQQTFSDTIIKAFVPSEVLVLSLQRLHVLISQSQAFLQLAKILNQAADRTFMFDHSLTPTEKYQYLNHTKPDVARVFPVKMIASYLKLAPETLSRVRARY